MRHSTIVLHNPYQDSHWCLSGDRGSRFRRNCLVSFVEFCFSSYTNPSDSVDFWFFSFSFDFGARKQGPPALNLAQFYALCEKSGPPDNSEASKATEGLNVQLKISLQDGSFPMPSDDKVQTATTKPDDTGAGVKWFVKGGSFQFRVSSVFALTEAYIETEHSANRDDKGNTVPLADQIKHTETMDEVLQMPAINTLSSLPMQLGAHGSDGIKSQLAISIQDVDDENLPVSDFKPSFVVKPMAQALWADSPPDRLTKDKGTIDLPMAVTLEAPDPVLAKAKVPAFNATDMAKACAGKSIFTPPTFYIYPLTRNQAPIKFRNSLP